MNIELHGTWHKTEYGYLIGAYAVSENNKLLMYDEDMYYSLGKFLEHIKKRFIKNPRFVWHKCEVNREQELFVIYGWDNKTN
jgi:hypothetical protein